MPTDRKGILIRADKGLWYDMKLYALEQETTLNDACHRALEDFLARAKSQEMIPPPPPQSSVNWAVLHQAYGEFYKANCPADVQKNKKKRAAWRSENPLPFDGTLWVPHYTPMLSNSGKNIMKWHIEYHGSDGRQVDNDPYRNTRSQRTGAGRASVEALEWERTRAIGLDEENVAVPRADLNAVLDSNDDLVKALSEIHAASVNEPGYGGSPTEARVIAALAKAGASS